jgi:hypothetical protein
MLGRMNSPSDCQHCGARGAVEYGACGNCLRESDRRRGALRRIWRAVDLRATGSMRNASDALRQRQPQDADLDWQIRVLAGARPSGVRRAREAG